ncbi:TPA: RHS repeat-associated core domain-containing protein [Neisseria subflava]
MGNRTETIRPDGQRIGYLHYGSGHLHGITLNRNEIAAFERDKLHRETERTFGKHIRQETQYDPMGRILQQIHNRSRREYGYDAAGQLTHIQSKGGQTQYRYDPIGRLIAAVTPDFSETFAFDPAGNRLNLSGNKQDRTGQTSSQEKPSLNKVWGNLLKEYSGVHYDYDQRGNLIRKTRNGETTDYHWNGYNQLVKIENLNGSTEYRYDPLGRRTAKIRNGETTVYHWQEDTLAIESTNGQNIHYLFEPGTFEPLAQFQTASPIGIEREDKPAEPYSYDPETDPLLKIPPEPQEQSEAQPELVYYQLDHLGTPIAAHNAKGEAVWTAEYEAWGRIRNETVSDGLKANIPFRFQGQYYDEESGLHYNRFRYYDPAIGRFVSQDPIGLMGGINVYIYASNPIEWVDPFGLASKSSFAVRHGPSAPQKINGKFPINSCFAGKTMTMKDVNQNILKKYPGLSSKYQHGVPFNMMGFPDFSRYAIRTVNLPGGFISDSKDFSQANRIAFGNSNNYKDKGNMIIDGKRYIWHHTEKNGKIQLIPYDLHDAIKHTGGAAVCGTRKR